ncbi:hypothetical protein K437DRAFT_178241 [Tilletiaria anomala UBC 951]|uniref:RanBD1 domain-containing protein n=1 Tax=Tilletiaria anomala (strain ATCC 24038 / CBS 436.72 / UBC 951) TaxID=1037660 RepID=A0A066VM51_TILAU|nr:uncharacterized protein K437DRAFT_178241 [Tilletiaria anomala UBC 951]KDN41328.1 hypothetical protein K437DRAFT_178241 [Tilletiaria anomala UBC 951]
MDAHEYFQEAGPSRQPGLRSTTQLSSSPTLPPAKGDDSFGMVDSFGRTQQSGVNVRVGRSPRTPRVRASPYSRPHASSSSRLGPGATHEHGGSANSPFGAPALSPSLAYQAGQLSAARKLDIRRPARGQDAAGRSKAKAAGEEDVHLAQEAAKSPGMLQSFLSLISPYRSARKERSAAFGPDLNPNVDAERRAATASPLTRRLNGVQDSERASQLQADKISVAAALGTRSGNRLRGVLSQPSLPRHAGPTSSGFAKYSRMNAAQGLFVSSQQPSVGGVEATQRMAEEDADSMQSTDQGPEGIASPATMQTPTARTMQGSGHNEGVPDYSPQRNYSLLSKFFTEKSGASSSGDAEPLTELELAGCMKLIEECASAGRDLESEFGEIAAGHDITASIASNANSGGLLGVAGPSRTGLGVSPRRSESIGSSPSMRAGLYDVEVGGRPTPQLRPSRSFLSPYHVAKKTQAASAATVLAPVIRSPPASVSPAARRTRRTIYLGPGLSVAASPRTANRMRQAPPAQTLELPSFVVSSAGFGSKRVRREEPGAEPPMDSEMRDTRAQRDQEAGDNASPPTSLASSSTPFTNNALTSQPASFPQPASPVPMTPSRSQPQYLQQKQNQQVTTQGASPTAAAYGSAQPTMTRSATASALLGILQEHPLEPSPRPQPRLEVINPYQNASVSARLPSSSSSNSVASAPRTPGSLARARDRGSISERMAKSRAQAVANAKRKAAEEASKKESVLDLIEKSAPSPRNNKRLRSSAAASDAASGDASNTLPLTVASRDQPLQENDLFSRGAAVPDKAEKSKAATEEAKRRTQALQEKEKEQEKAKASAKTKAVEEEREQMKAKQAAKTSSDKPAAALPSKLILAPSSNGNLAAPSSPFSFQLPAQLAASIPKKPSPLATAVSAAPDSPGSDREDRTSISSAQTTPSKPVSTRSAAESGIFPFTTPATKCQGTPTPAAASTTPVSAPPFTLTAAATPKISAPALVALPQTSRDVALGEPPSALPIFDFALPSRVNERMLSAAERAARDTALSTLPKDLPAFKFNDEPAGSAAATQTPFSFPSQASGSSTSGSAAPSPTILSLPTSSPTAIKFSPSKPSAPPQPSSESSASEGTEDGEITSRDKGPGEGEEDEDTQHEVRVKAWRKDGAAWKDVGVGMLRLKKKKSSDKRRMLMRSEGNGNVLINFNLVKGLTARQDKTQIVFMGFEASEMVNFRVKAKSASEAAALKAAIEKEAAHVA